jgi:hypothetical protein
VLFSLVHAFPKKEDLSIQRKLSETQKHSTTEESSLSIETFKGFCTTILMVTTHGSTDHENLICKHFNTDCVMRWRLFIEECSPDLRHQGKLNIAADALSCLKIMNTNGQKHTSTLNPLIQVLRHGHERITCNVAILCHK